MNNTKFIKNLFTIRSVRSIFPALPLLYFMVRAYFISAETNAIYTGNDKMQEKVFRVADTTGNKSPADYVQITFYESARINKRLKSLPDYSTYLSHQKETKETNLFALVTLASAYTNTTMKVRPIQLKGN